MSELVSPVEGTRYPAFAYRGTPDLMRAAAAVLLGLVGYLFTVGFVNSAIVGVGYLFSRRTEPFSDYAVQASRFERPIGMLGAHLGIGMLALVALIVARFVLGVRPGYLISVAGRTRWWFVAASFAVAALVLNAMVWTLQRATVQHFSPQHDWPWFLVIIVLTSPLQAAAEEFFFRGLLLQTFGALTRNPWIGIVGSAFIFALFHGTQSSALFFDRFAFAILAGVLVWATGGLEAGIAAHIANNMSAFIYAAMFSTVAAARTQTQVSWVAATVDLVSFAVIALLCWLISRWGHLRTTIAGPAAGLANRSSVR